RRVTGRADRAFLERVFHKLLLNFTWWVNRKDADGHNVFQGGFLGLDNIGVFDRSAPLPVAGHLGQADGTAWMGMYCLNMLAIALELAREDPVYEDLASKFFEHFLYIADALNDIGGMGVPLWDNDDEFFYDVLHFPDGRFERLKVRSLVGLMPLLAVEAIQKFHHYYGDDFLVECPTGSGNKLTLWQIAAEISRRLESIFLRGPDGRRPVFGQVDLFQSNPYWCEHVPFHEYFHGDTGR